MVFRPKLAETTLRFDTSPLNTYSRNHPKQYSDPNWQKLSPDLPLPLTHLVTATASRSILTQSGKNYPQIRHFPSEYLIPQPSQTVF